MLSLRHVVMSTAYRNFALGLVLLGTYTALEHLGRGGGDLRNCYPWQLCDGSVALVLGSPRLGSVR